jgi:hypothetical protein
MQAPGFDVPCIESPPNEPPCQRHIAPAAERFTAYPLDCWRASVCAAVSLPKFISLATFLEIILLELEPPLQRKNDLRQFFVRRLVNSAPV